VPKAIATARLLGLISLLCVLAGGCGSFSASNENAEGVSLFQQAQYQAAIDKFQLAASHDAKNADACYNLGCVYHRLANIHGDPNAGAQAEQFYHMAIDRDPNHVEAHRALAVYLVEKGQNQQAFNLLEGWVAQQPNAADARIELARLSEELGDKHAAKVHLLEALAIDHQNPRTLNALGHLRDEAGEYAQAMDNYRRSLEYDRFQPEVAARANALQTSRAPASLYTPAAPDSRFVSTDPALRR